MHYPFPPDPIRQKMLFKTEWRTLGAQGDTPALLSQATNRAVAELLSDGFNIAQVMLLSPSIGMGVLVVGQRASSPVNDPTPQGVPIAGTSAQQQIEVTYSFIEGGQSKQAQMRSLQDAVKAAAHDLETSAHNGTRQPISIHVMSITAYGAADLHVLREKFG